ncbi:MAG: hypothetical protein ACKO85_08470, partial [Isosphaeraceae bacterium]
MRILLILLALLSVFPTVTGNLHAEDVETPLYTNWSKFPVGTSVTQKSTVTENNVSVITTTITTLISKTERNLILSKVVSSNATGTLIKNDPIESTINRMFPVLPGVDKTKIGRPQGSQASG